MVSRFTVTMCVSMAVMGGNLRFFCPGDLAIFGVVFFTIFFCFLANCNTFGSLGEFFAHRAVGFLFLIVVGLGHGDPSLSVATVL